jgi:glycosyltransferase involved in cell wall biosynthesis/ubiquinone/menaquinone biosynthesis C-methylase UbiE
MDYFGASACIAKALGLAKPLHSRATWSHGWLWHGIEHPGLFVDDDDRHVSRLVCSAAQEALLRGRGYARSFAVGLPLLYAEAPDVPRIPDSILAFPLSVAPGAGKVPAGGEQDYVEHVRRLRDEFALVAAVVGGEDVRLGNWIDAFEKAGIPWIAGAWAYDRQSLARWQILLRQFEFVTSNVPGSHFAYAAYCGCKASLDGPEDGALAAELARRWRRWPDLADVARQRDWRAAFRREYPFFAVPARQATLQTDWARQALGQDHKKRPEDIAGLFEWNLRRLPSGRWAPANPQDALTNDELLAKATAKSMVGRHDEAFKLTNVLKRRQARPRDMEILRARYFLSKGNTHGAREALKEELRHFPDNAQADKMFQALGGDAVAAHVAASEEEKEFIDFFNALRPYTRLSVQRAKSLYDLARRVCREDRPGNIVECGVAAGGSSILLALVVQRHSRIARKVFAFDTFTGMPEPEAVDTAKGVPADETGWGAGTCAAPEAFVREQCRRFGVGDIVETRKGLFEDTLPIHRGEIGEIALLHMDADWYSSTMTILDNLFDQLVDDALIQIDDWGAWDGCKKAVLDYAARQGLTFDVHGIDDTGVWCVKPARPGRRPAADAQASPPSRDPAFLAPQPSPEFMDLYLVRQGILRRLEQAIPLFSGVFLDVGCGQMPYRDHILARNSAITRYVGLDFAAGKYAERRRPDLTWDGRTIPLPDAGVDSVMATEVLEHCPDPLPVLREIRRVLAPGGVLFFTTPFLWPIHDAPHDHYRYTPYALARLLAEAGFEDARVEALGGWNASLAQMIGLWLRRAPMDGQERARLTRDLHPFFTELVRTDVVPEDFSRNPMVTGLAGTARAPGARAQAAPTAGGPRVVVVTDQFPVLSQTFILEQLTGLIDRGVAVDHWSMERLNEPVVHEAVARYGLLQRTRFVRLPPEALRGDPKRWTEHFLRRNNLGSLDDVAAVQIHFGPNFNKLAPLFAARPDLFVVTSFHGYDASATFTVKGPDVYAGLFARADRITTPSRYMKEALARHGCPPDKIVVHHYGKDVRAFAPPPRRDGGRTVRVLTVARFVEKKGLEYALAGFAAAQAGFDVEYRLAGYGPLAGELSELARRLGVADKVRFLGQLTNEAVKQEMAEADIFVLTSVTAANGDQEGVPVSLIEAQALGLPVVSSRHAGIPELVVHDKTGFLAEERNVEEIAGYLRALIKSPALREALGAQARQRALQEFDLSALNDALAGLLLDRGAGGGRPPLPANPQDEAAAAGVGDAPAVGPVYCPICRTRHARFRDFGRPPRPNALCPACTSLERHRALWLFLERRTNLLATPGLRLLHFAPEACLEPRFRQLFGAGYVTADLQDPRADVRADITALQFPDASFDAVHCSHVLEHVPDDRKAMRELWRVLVPGGLALVMVPLRGAVTEEDLAVTDPDERTRRYGQADHVRYYGADIVDRLREAGFVVDPADIGTMFSAQERASMGLGGGLIHVCRKPAAKPASSGVAP